MVVSGRKFTPVLAGVLAGLFATVVIGSWQRSRPNVVMIVVDSMRGDAISDAVGAARTPNLVALAAEGVSFPLAYSHSSVTAPAHAALYSSTYPHENGVVANGQPVHAGVPLLPEWLNTHGYQTAAVVSLEAIWKPEVGQGLERGFQVYDQSEKPVDRGETVNHRFAGILEQIDPNESFFLVAHFADPHAPYDDYEGPRKEAQILLDDRPVDTIITSYGSLWERRLTLTPGSHLLEFSSEAGIQLSRFRFECDGQQLPYELRSGEFSGESNRIVLRLTNPSDGELEVEVSAWTNDNPSLQELRERYKREIESVDRAIGQLLAELKWRGLYDDTIVILTAGHGEALGEHDHVGHDVNLHDEILHVPLIVRLPADRPERALLIENSAEIVRHVDLAPTILELLDLPAWEGMEGTSLLKEARRTLLAEAYPPATPGALFAMRDQRFKLIFDPQGTGNFELYRLSSDPLELENVFDVQGHLRQEWQAELRSVAADALGKSF